MDQEACGKKSLNVRKKQQRNRDSDSSVQPFIDVLKDKLVWRQCKYTNAIKGEFQNVYTWFDIQELLQV